MNVIQNNSTLNQMENDSARMRFQEGQKNLGSTKLGKDAFLQLLLAQLKHQDPMNPMEDTEFISQQAQFTQIEKLDELNQNLSKANQIAQAGSIVGKSVEARLDSGELLSGTIDSVTIGADSIGLNIGNRTVSMDQVVRIFAAGQP